MGKSRTDTAGKMNVLKSRTELLCLSVNTLDEFTTPEDLHRLLADIDSLRAKVVRYAKDLEQGSRKDETH
ncbi:hypothetical protein [Exiguobacterium sp.]|uniref:hypothetical protein n=1 Tax=Exiguobacterium sp. TaxID=44751 RepID=UPI00263BBF46|nr:hypothetical protein [Exiguobacterium sp.]MCC5891436.1 hypothetical protein [Exiguobacterium sp.]